VVAAPTADGVIVAVRVIARRRVARRDQAGTRRVVPRSRACDDAVQGRVVACLEHESNECAARMNQARRAKSPARTELIVQHPGDRHRGSCSRCVTVAIGTRRGVREIQGSSYEGAAKCARCATPEETSCRGAEVPKADTRSRVGLGENLGYSSVPPVTPGARCRCHSAPALAELRMISSRPEDRTG